MKKLVLLSCLFGLPILHGCSFTGQKHLKCDDPNAIVLLQKNLQEQLEKKLDIGLKDLIKNPVRCAHAQRVKTRCGVSYKT